MWEETLIGAAFFLPPREPTFESHQRQGESGGPRFAKRRLEKGSGLDAEGRLGLDALTGFPWRKREKEAQTGAAVIEGDHVCAWVWGTCAEGRVLRGVGAGAPARY